MFYTLRSDTREYLRRAPINAQAIVPRARSLEGASVRGATKGAHLFSSNGQHEAASTPPLEDRAGAAFEFGLLMLVTRTRGCEGIGRGTRTQ